MTPIFGLFFLLQTMLPVAYKYVKYVSMKHKPKSVLRRKMLTGQKRVKVHQFASVSFSAEQ